MISDIIKYKQNKMKGNFKFWCPIEKSVTNSPDSAEQMVLGGIASTADKDSDGEYLDPNGFDITPLMNSGTVNWHHQAKGQPAAIIGEPIRGEIRPEGLYLETKLYPSSSVARDVWNLATTLERDSSTRRLGYSIEGRVVERASSDPNNPDYKRVIKAVITGVAITHMPKNAQTFANIIKGEGCDEDEEELYDEEDVESEDKSMTTETAAALKKESLDRDLKVQTFSKSECFDLVLATIPNITITKAKQVVSLIESIANMKKSNKEQITEEDICKAYEALGLQTPDTNADPFAQINDILQKAEEENELDEEDDDDVEEDEEKDGDYDEEADHDDDEDEEVSKASDYDALGRIEKAIATSYIGQTRNIKALGQLLKSQGDEIDELKEIVKAQEETISSLTEMVETYGSRTPRRAHRSIRTASREFAKAEDDDEDEEIRKGEDGLSMSRNRSQVADILDQATFAKGFDDEFSKACMSFESSGTISSNVIARLKNEFGVNIVK